VGRVTVGVVTVGGYKTVIRKTVIRLHVSLVPVLQSPCGPTATPLATCAATNTSRTIAGRAEHLVHFSFQPEQFCGRSIVFSVTRRHKPAQYEVKSGRLAGPDGGLRHLHVGHRLPRGRVHPGVQRRGRQQCHCQQHRQRYSHHHVPLLQHLDHYGAQSRPRQRQGGRQRLLRLPRHGGAVQVDPRLLQLTLYVCFQRLQLKHDKLLSNVAFNCNLRHYAMGDMFMIGANHTAGQSTRPILSSP